MIHRKILNIFVVSNKAYLHYFSKRTVKFTGLIET